MTSEFSYNLFAVLTFLVWVPTILVLFACMTPRRAVIAAFVIGYLFLPEIGFSFHTMPQINKVSLTAFGVVLGSFIFDPGRLFSIRPRLMDAVCVLMIASPMATSLSNDLGIMDGFSSVLTIFFRWGLAYWIGRAYFTDWTAVRELAMGIVLGGVAYIPLCWWEIRMSPQLHGQIYGVLFESFRDDTYLFGVRLFGYRPNVFLLNGLTVTMYMAMCSVLAFWAWMTGSPRKLLGMPMGWVAIALIITTVFCKALGGIVLMTSGIAVLMLARSAKTRIPALVLLLAAPAYMIFRTGGDFSGDALIQAAAFVSPTRSQSLKFRIDNENLLAAKAMRRPMLGWGGWSRSHAYDAETSSMTISDGLWIIILGEAGLVGLGAFTLLVSGSSIGLWRRIPTGFWKDPACAAPVALAVVLGMYMVDSLFNATFNPVASLAAGAVGSMAAVARSTFSRKAAQPVPAQPIPVRQAMPPFVSSAKDLSYVYSTHRS